MDMSIPVIIVFLEYPIFVFALEYFERNRDTIACIRLIPLSDRSQLSAKARLHPSDVTETQTMPAAKRSPFCIDEETEFCFR